MNTDIVEGNKLKLKYMSDTFFDRLITEKTELDQKREKLDNFIDAENFEKLDPVQKSLLKIQSRAMATYTMCLHERIMNLRSTATVNGGS